MQAVNKNQSMSDSAVDGLLAGLAAGVVMAVFLMVGGWLAGTPPAEVMGLFSPTGDGSAFLGGLAHLSVSAIYGLIFGAALYVIADRLPAWLAGVVFGFFLYLIGQYFIVPTTESTLQAFSNFSFLTAHLVYGLVLGWITGRRTR